MRGPRPAPRPSVGKKPETLESKARPEAAAGDIGGGLRRMRALIRKEMLQILRDPSSLVVAVVLPLLLLFLFGFGVSFDVTNMRIGVVIENPNARDGDVRGVARQHAVFRGSRRA